MRAAFEPITPAFYYGQIAKPSNAEFFRDNGSLRLAMLACSATYHVLDYVAQGRSETPKLGNRLLEGLQAAAREGAAFRAVEGYALASKHCLLARKDLKDYHSGMQIRAYPAIAGRAKAGASFAGDRTGGICVGLPDGRYVNLTHALRRVQTYYEETFPEVTEAT